MERCFCRNVRLFWFIFDIMIYYPQNPFDFNFERTVFSDNNYAMVGKALTIATKFDNEVKCLLNYFKLRSKPEIVTDKDELDAFIKEIEEFQYLNTTIKKLKLDKDDFKSFFEDAKKSRNFIAHELTIGLEIISESDDTRNRIKEELNIHIFKIAEAVKFL